MEFSESYLEVWTQSAVETLADPRVLRFLLEAHGITAPPAGFAEHYIRTFDTAMRSYATSWLQNVQSHQEAELYKQMAQHMRHEGVWVDLGCGTGHLIAASDHDKVIGVDINGYQLQLAEATLRAAGRAVQRFGGSYISFAEEREGFIVKPDPVLEEVDLNGTILLCDDMTTMHNTIRVLYNQGVKADTVSFTLFGGNATYEGLRFIEGIKKHAAEAAGVEYKSSFEDLDTFSFVDTVIQNVHKICRSGGRFYMGIREAHQIKGFEELSGYDLQAAHANRIEIVKAHEIGTLDENKIANGVTTSAHYRGPEELTPEQQAAADNAEYKLTLVEAIVR